MADKFRKTAPLRITIGQGEQPTHTKLNALSDQARNSSGLLEKAIGDLWGQSGDSLLYSFPIQLTNLARSIGEAKYMNPVLYDTASSFNFYENIGTKYIGKTEGYLKYNPNGSITQSVGSAFTTSVLTEDLVDTAGEFWVDSSTGRFKTFTVISNEVIYYEVDPTDNWYMQEDTLPTIIPDPRQPDFTGCRLEKTGSNYFLHLPPRIGITTLYWRGQERPESYPTDAELTNNYSTLATPPYKMFQDPSSNALGAQHYRYPLPPELDSLSPGDYVPEGFIYLWDQTNATVIEGISFLVTSTSWKFQLITTTQDTFLTARADAPGDETETSYNDPALSVIICSASLTKAHSTLLSSFLNHQHNGEGTLERPISHNALEDQNPPTSVYTGHTSSYPSYLPPWSSSNWADDRHTSLLSRAGAQTTSTNRDPYKNAMLGHLLMANADTSGSNSYLDADCNDDSFRMYFGETTGASSFFKDSLTQFVFEDTNGSKLVTRDSSNGVALYMGIDSGGDAWLSTTDMETDGNSGNALNLVGETNVVIKTGAFPSSSVIQALSSGYVYINNGLGINESSPDTIVHIKSDTRTDVIKIEDTVGHPSGSYIDFRFKNYTSDPIKFGITETSGSFPIAGIANTVPSGNGPIYLDATGDVRIKAGNDGYVNHGIKFYTAAGTVDWTIDGAGDLFSASGNLGVGTTTPTSNLEVSDATGAVLTLSRLGDSAIAAGEVIGDIDAMGDEVGQDTFPIGARIRFESTEAWQTGGDTDDAPTEIQFWTSPDGGPVAERWRITDDGHLVPSQARVHTLGDSNYILDNIYTNEITGGLLPGETLILNSSNELIFNAGASSIEMNDSGDLYPTTNGQDLGGTGVGQARWEDVYAENVDTEEINQVGAISKFVTNEGTGEAYFALYLVNNSGGTIAKGNWITGDTTSTTTKSIMVGASGTYTAGFVGIATEQITHGSSGWIAINGMVLAKVAQGVAAFNVGMPLTISATTNGVLYPTNIVGNEKLAVDFENILGDSSTQDQLIVLQSGVV